MTSIVHSNGATVTSSQADAEQQLWDSYNHLMMSPDVERLRKVFAREELFRRTIDIPGDIVECGVFKGLLCSPKHWRPSVWNIAEYSQGVGAVLLYMHEY